MSKSSKPLSEEGRAASSLTKRNPPRVGPPEDAMMRRSRKLETPQIERSAPTMNTPATAPPVTDRTTPSTPARNGLK